MIWGREKKRKVCTLVSFCVVSYGRRWVLASAWRFGMIIQREREEGKENECIGEGMCMIDRKDG